MRECRHCRPEILEGNNDIWRLIELCDNQWRAGFGIVGFDFAVAIEVAGAMNIEINQTFFEKLRAYERTVLEKLREKSA